jgi:hypothetical protein
MKGETEMKKVAVLAVLILGGTYGIARGGSVSSGLKLSGGTGGRGGFAAAGVGGGTRGVYRGGGDGAGFYDHGSGV